MGGVLDFSGLSMEGKNEVAGEAGDEGLLIGRAGTSDLSISQGGQVLVGDAMIGTSGGSSGTTPGGGTSTQPTITLELQTAAGASTTVVNNITTVSARATVRNSSGAPIAGQVVTFTQEGGLARFVPAGGTAAGSNTPAPRR